MLDRLLESKVRRNRSLLGASVSITAHLLVVAAAVHATAQSRPRASDPTRVLVLPFVPNAPPVVRAEGHHQGRNSRRPVLAPPLMVVKIDPGILPIDLPIAPTDPSDFARKGIVAARDSDAQLGGSDPATTFRADQVERQVSLLPGAPLPKYPESLRGAGIEGKVVAEFVVDEEGRVALDSVRFVRSDNVLFEEAVRNVLKRTHFAPAEIGGKKVRQLVQMPFVFTISAR